MATPCPFLRASRLASASTHQREDEAERQHDDREENTEIGQERDRGHGRGEKDAGDQDEERIEERGYAINTGLKWCGNNWCSEPPREDTNHE